VLRQNPLRQVLFWTCMIIAAACLAFGGVSIGGILLAVFFVAAGVLGTTTLKLTITDDEIVVRGPPTRRAPRAGVTVIHVWPTNVQFVDKDDQRVIGTNSGWGKDQLDARSVRPGRALVSGQPELRAFTGGGSESGGIPP
jgi:hypothetical protein